MVGIMYILKKGGQRKLRNEELHNFYSLPNIVRVIKSGRMRWMGHVVCTWDMRNTYRIVVRKSQLKRSL